MKKIAAITLIIFISIGSLMAQGNRPGFEKYMEKFKAEKIAFLTEKLDLSVEEAQKFWPIYNQYEEKRGELLSNKRMEFRGRGHEHREMSAEEMEAMVDQRVEQELKLAELKMKFHKELKKTIPIEKVVRLYQAEGEFMNYMLKKLDEQRSERRRGGNRIQ